jgi:hypothetical protein
MQSRWLVCVGAVLWAVGTLALEVVVPYQEQIQIYINNTKTPTMRMQLTVDCTNGESQYYTALNGGAISNIFVNCSSAQTTQTMTLDRWVQFQTQTYRVQAFEAVDYYTSSDPAIIDAASSTFNQSMQFVSHPANRRRDTRTDYSTAYGALVGGYAGAALGALA